MVQLGWLVPLFTISMLMAIIFPIILMLVVRKKLKAHWLPLGIGAAMWLAALVRFIPLYIVVIPLSIFFAENWIFVIGSVALFALAAGVFEEIARYIAFKFILKKHNSWSSSVMYGVGHGGTEAVLIGLLIGLNILYVLALLYMDLSTMMPAEDVEVLKEMFTSMAWYEALMGGVERILTVVFHIGMSVLVYQAVKYKVKWFVVLAILLHAFVNFLAVVTALFFGVLPAEIVIAVFAIVAILIILVFRKAENIEKERAPKVE
jgi:uncharacterized membrane protein YhfC